jgi:hypothetical protein
MRQRPRVAAARTADDEGNEPSNAPETVSTIFGSNRPQATRLGSRGWCRRANRPLAAHPSGRFEPPKQAGGRETAGNRSKAFDAEQRRSYSFMLLRYPVRRLATAAYLS